MNTTQLTLCYFCTVIKIRFILSYGNKVAYFEVFCSRYYLERFTLAGIYLTNKKLVSVGVLFYAENPADNYIFYFFALCFIF